MKRSNLKYLRGLSLFSILALTANARGEGEWLRHFRLGATFGLNVSAEFKNNGTFAVPGISPGPATPGILLTYVDGFVGIDETGNAANLTSNFGYSQQSQYDQQGQTLTFHGTKAVNANGFDEVSDNPLGFELVYGATFRKWERVAIGGELGFGLSVFGPRSRSPLEATLIRGIHQYQVPDGVVLPSAPYTGGPDAAGRANINDVPTDLGDETVAGTVTGDRKLDGILYNFRVGPLVRWEFYPRWTLNGSAGGVFGIFDAEYQFNETITPITGAAINNRGKFGSSDITYGGYAGAVVMYDTGAYWEAYLGAHFMSLKDGEVESFGRSATMHLDSSVFITAGINWSF
jgi:hypothetical protein